MKNKLKYADKTVKKNKGFTLIELLAVIIILGVLMIIAIPSVTTYISNSRKNAYIDTAKEIIGGARNLVNEGKLEMFDENVTYYLPQKCINTENESTTPYGEFDIAYVGVIYNGDGYKYYWISIDTAKQGIGEVTSADNLDIELLKSDLDRVEIQKTVDTMGVLGRESILILKDDCKTWDEEKKAKNILNENGEIEEVIENPIYWALQDINSDGVNETFVLSTSAVDGNYSGVFSGNKSFTSYTEVPWVKAASYTNTDLARNVNNIVINGTLRPQTTAYWFYGVGHSASSMNVDFHNLNTSNVTNMSHMFDSFASGMQTLNIDVSFFDTSNVINMEFLFSQAGRASKTWSIGNLSNWNVSNVTNMHCIFSSAGENATYWSVGNLSSWNTSNVTNMAGAFGGAGRKATTLDLSYLKNWNVSNVTNMSSMFESTGENVTNLVIDLSGWNTSSLKSTSDMFWATGLNSRTVTINLSGWNTSNVTSMYYMFTYSGQGANTWTVTIPSTNGGGISNTITDLYGKTTSVSARSREACSSCKYKLGN